MTPPRPPADPRPGTRDLRVVLEGLAHALDSGDPAAVLDHEPKLRAAVSALVPPGPIADDARAALREDVLAARAALARCRAIGGALGVMVDATLDTLGRTAGYDRHGAGAAAAPAVRNLARV